MQIIRVKLIFPSPSYDFYRDLPVITLRAENLESRYQKMARPDPEKNLRGGAKFPGGGALFHLIK